jgi:hypothetical protein
VWDHLNKEIENFAVFGVKSAILTTSSKLPETSGQRFHFPDMPASLLWRSKRKPLRFGATRFHQQFIE